MNKGIKKVGKVVLCTLSGIVLCLFAISLAVALAFSMPRVQTFAAARAVEYLSEWLNTTVSISRVAVTGLNTIDVSDLYIQDYERDTLFYASHAAVKLDRMALLYKGRLSIRRGSFDRAYFRLHEYAEGNSNLKQITDYIEAKIGPRDDAQPFKVGRVTVTDSRFELKSDREQRPVPAGSIDYADMSFSHIDGIVSDLIVTKQLTEMKIVRLSGVERTGCVVDDTSVEKFAVTQGMLSFDNLAVSADGSRLSVPSLLITAPSWTDYQQFNDKVTVTVEIENSLIRGSTVRRCFGLPDCGLTAEEVSLTYDGKVNDFKAWIGSARIGRTEIVADAHVKGATDLRSAHFDIKALNFATTPDQVHGIFRSVFAKELPEKVSEYLDRFETIEIDASASGNIDAAAVTVAAVTDLGSADINGNITLADGRTAFDGTVEADSFDAGKLLAIADLGQVSFSAEGAADIGKKYVDARGKAAVDKIIWHGYEYRDIKLDGTYADDILRAAVSSDDPNMAFDLDGTLDLSWLEPQYNVVLNIQKADFAATGLSHDRNRQSWLSCNVEASGEGSSLDYLVGRGTVNNFLYVSGTDTLTTELVNIVANNSDSGKSISAYSSIADIEYRSRASYAQVIDYLGNRFLKQFPLMGGNAPVGDSGFSTDDYSTVTVNIKSGHNLLSTFVDDLSLSSESSLNFAFSPSTEHYSFALNSGYVEWRDYLFSEVRIDSGNRAGEVWLTADAEEILALGTSIPDVVLNATSKGDDLSVELVFSDNSTMLSGKIAADGHLGREADGKVYADCSIGNSFLLNGGDLWSLSSSKLEYRRGCVNVSALKVECGEQRIFADGEISESLFTPLQLSLENVRLGGLAELLTGYDGLRGLANGNANVMSVTGKPFGSGQIALSNLSVGGLSVDPLDFAVSIVSGASDILMKVRNSELDTTLADISYNPSKRTYKADITASEMQLSLLRPILPAEISDISGTSAVDLHIAGAGNTLNVNGNVKVDNMRTAIAYTGVEYRFSPLVLTFNNNVGTLAHSVITDKNDRKATIDGFVNIANLNNISYGARIVPDNLLVLDTQAETADQSFYGTLYASGAVDVTGNSLGTDINAALRTGDGSVFCLPLNNDTDFSSADFVRFVSEKPAEMPDTTNIVVRKKLQLQTKKLKVRRPAELNVDVMLNVGTNTQLKLIIDPATDNVLLARGMADMNITYNPRKDDFAIRGDYHITDGVYNFNFQNIISKQFTINQGSYIRWNGSPMDAAIDVSATYKLKTSLAPLLGNDKTTARSSTPVECIINLSNRLSAIDLSFDINVPTANPEYQNILSSYFSSQEMMATQFVYLLALGGFYSDTDTSTQGVTAGTTAGTAIGFDFLTDQVSKLVSNDSYKFNLKYKMINSASSSYGVDFQTELIDDKLLLELEANVDTGEYQATSDVNQLSGGGSLTLLLDPSGNFILKGFSRTIDRFDENQGLQENGVGLYYRRSFDKFSDLWRKKARKTSNEKRKK